MTITQIILIVAVIIGLILLMRLIQPKLSSGEKYLLHIVQHKSPQPDNIRLFMWIKMIARPINDSADLAKQEEFLGDVEKYRQFAEQFYAFGPNALYPLLGYETLQWHLDVHQSDPLVVRLAANQVVRRFPHSAAVIEDLVIASPDVVTTRYLAHNLQELPEVKFFTERYSFLLSEMMNLIVDTSRNEWWPGVSPDIREWAESIQAKLAKRPQAKDDALSSIGN